MQREIAETITVQALGWLVANDELLSVFLGASGASLEDLRTGATDPALLGAVVDFLMMDDEWVLAFCHDAAIPPERLAEAREALPGGERVHWT